jgi:hypothetical protein
VVEFDTEWDIVLERTKPSKDLTGVHEFLRKWRHIAHTESTDPGSYFRVLAKAEQITHAQPFTASCQARVIAPEMQDATTHPESGQCDSQDRTRGLLHG